MHLMARLFEVHDRTRFGLYAFSFGPNTNDAMRSRLKDVVDVFQDVRSFERQGNCGSRAERRNRYCD